MTVYTHQSGSGFYLSLGDKCKEMNKDLSENTRKVATPIGILARTVSTFVLIRAFCMGGLLYNAICMGLHASKNLSLDNPEIRKHAKFMVCDGAMLLLPSLLPGGVLIKAALALAYGIKPDYVKRCYQQINARLGI